MALVEIGRHSNDHGELVVWDSANVVNPHVLIFGESGCGKTHQLKRIISQLARQRSARVFVFDVHSDLNLSPEITSSVKFSEVSSFGINPFLVDPDPDAGGVRRRINAFILMVNHYSRVLGEKQENALSRLIEQFYRHYGFDPDKPSTWKRDDAGTPTFLDFKNFTRDKVKSLYMGSSGDMRKAMDALSSKLRALAMAGAKERSAKDYEALDDLRKNCADSFEQVLDSLQTGKELDEFIDEDNREVMRSVYKRIENLGRTGIFKSRKPAFDRSKPVWRFDVFNLTNEARGFLVEVYLDRIFTSAKIAGLQKEPTTYIVIDEAHLFLSEEHDHIINRLVREARKFGVALLLSSQSHSHFPEDIATGCGTRVILGIDEQYRERLGRLFGLKPSRFQAIKPRKSALIQMKLHNAELSNGFEDVLLGSQ